MQEAAAEGEAVVQHNQRFSQQLSCERQRVHAAMPSERGCFQMLLSMNMVWYGHIVFAVLFSKARGPTVLLGGTGSVLRRRQQAGLPASASLTKSAGKGLVSQEGQEFVVHHKRKSSNSGLTAATQEST